MEKEKLTTKKCLYCDNNTIEIPHFMSDCCGRGMCEDCYGALVGTDEQLQVDHYDLVEEEIKPEYQNATYLCFADECAKKWKVKND